MYTIGLISIWMHRDCDNKHESVHVKTKQNLIWASRKAIRYKTPPLTEKLFIIGTFWQSESYFSLIEYYWIYQLYSSVTCCPLAVDQTKAKFICVCVCVCVGRSFLFCFVCLIWLFEKELTVMEFIMYTGGKELEGVWGAERM